MRDTVRECLEKDPTERTEDDIEVLLEFMQHLPVSSGLGDNRQVEIPHVYLYWYWKKYNIVRKFPTSTGIVTGKDISASLMRISSSYISSMHC